MRECIRRSERLVQTNMEQTPGYSEDKYCEEAREKIRKACGMTAWQSISW